MSIFLEHNHLFLRNPRGGVEHVDRMAAAGFTAIFCNVKDYGADEWALVRQRAVEANVICGPWLRTTYADQEHGDDFEPALLDLLLDIADEWGTPLIVNSESELKGSEDDLTTYITEKCGSRDWALSMEPWPFANVDWTPIEVPVLPQLFGEQWGADAEDAREEWYRVGVNCVVNTYGSYNQWQPSLYDLLSPFGVYTADDIGWEIDPWRATGTRYPCKATPPDPSPGVDMEKIGKQHGITGFASWLREQDVPPRGPNYDPDDVDTWPWPDKIERTLNILAKDHDEQAST